MNLSGTEESLSFEILRNSDQENAETGSVDMSTEKLKDSVSDSVTSSSPTSLTTAALSSFTAPYKDKTEGEEEEDLLSPSSDIHVASVSLMQSMMGSFEGLLESCKAQQQQFHSLISGIYKEQRQRISQANRTAYMRPHYLLLLGFTTSFIFFLIHTLIHHWTLSQQHSALTNLTMTERQERLVYNEKAENLREYLMHKQYEETRVKGEELRVCKTEVEDLKIELGRIEEKMESKDIELAEWKGMTEGKVHNMKALIKVLKESNEKLQAGKKQSFMWGAVVGIILGVPILMLCIGGTKRV